MQYLDALLNNIGILSNIICKLVHFYSQLLQIFTNVSTTILYYRYAGMFCSIFINKYLNNIQNRCLLLVNYDLRNESYILSIDRSINQKQRKTASMISGFFSVDTCTSINRKISIGFISYPFIFIAFQEKKSAVLTIL